MSKSANRIISGAVGAIIILVGIALKTQLPDREREVQILVWTLVVVVMAALINHNHLREKWFWQGFCLGLALHGLLVYSVRYSLPFSSIGVAFLIGFPEVIVWQLMFRMLSTMGGTGNGQEG